MSPRSTIGDVLVEATRVLDRVKVADARREAMAIWAALARVKPGQLWLQRGEDAPLPVLARFRAALERRVRGEPLPYVLGVAGFRTIEVSVDRRVLIPRPETEGLVDRVLAWGAERKDPKERWGTAADVGTGSGCIALSLAVEGRFDRVIATDSSADALEVATGNARRVAPNPPVDLRLGPALEPLCEEVLDVVVSNPPYLTEGEHALLDPAVKDYEPREALVSHPDGMKHTIQLLEQSQALLADGGLLAVEIDSTRADMTLDLARQSGWIGARVEADLFGRPRYLLATKEF
jgi:release factor glutamine methyltransferase